MLHIHESTIRIIIVACVVLMEAMLPCYLATTILLLNFLNYIKHLYWESSGWSFSDRNGVNGQ